MNWKEYIKTILQNINIILVPQLYELVEDYVSQSSFYRYIKELEDEEYIEKVQLFKGSQTCYIRRRGSKALSSRRKYVELLLIQYKKLKKSRMFGTILDINQFQIPQIYQKLENVYPQLKNNAFFQMDKEYVNELMMFKKQSLLKKEGLEIPFNANKSPNILNLFNRGIYITGMKDNVIKFIILDVYNRMSREKLNNQIEMIYKIVCLYGINTKVYIEICTWNQAMENKIIKLLDKNKILDKTKDGIYSYSKYYVNNIIKVLNLDLQKHFGNLYIHL